MAGRGTLWFTGQKGRVSGQRAIETIDLATRLRDVMSADVATVGGAATLRDAATVMRDRDIGDVVVTSNGSVIGIVTDRDIVIRALADGLDASTTVESVFTEEVDTLQVSDSVAEAVALMRERHIRRIPVMDGDKLVGIVSLGDLAEERAPASVLGEISAAPPDK
ncbi:MAG TPA: CBS domain-containing protein [Acidimicrobiia bacterium]|nr:CBS domain-containing protein [Acidimicrobiia bacterium]